MAPRGSFHPILILLKDKMEDTSGSGGSVDNASMAGTCV